MTSTVSFLPMSRTAWRDHLAPFIATVAYATGLDFSYRKHLVPLQEANGFRDVEPTIETVLFAVALACLPSLRLSRFDARPSTLLVWIFYLSVIIPACVIPAHSLEYFESGYYLFSIFLVINIVVLDIFCRLPIISPITQPISAPSMAIGLSGAIILGLTLIISTYGIHPEAFQGLTILYDLRELNQIQSQEEPLPGYATSILGYALMPFIISLSLVRRNWLLFGGAVACQIIIFASAAQKSFIYLPPLIAIAFLILRLSLTRLVLILPFLLSILIWTLNIYAEMENDPLPSYLIIQRPFAVPGLLTGYYFDYFKDNPFVFLSHGPLKWLIDYPYTRPYAQLVGGTYLGLFHSWANANIWADGYAHAGMAGAGIVTLLMGLILRVIDSAATVHGARLIVLTMMGPMASLTNTALTTTLLTGGLGPLLLILALLPTASKHETEAIRHYSERLHK